MHNESDLNAAEIRLQIQREKRSAARKPTCSRFTLTLEAAVIEGAGSNISQTGAYLVTCDEIPVEIHIRGEGKDIRVPGRISRIDTISKESRGIAIRFDHRMLDV